MKRVKIFSGTPEEVEKEMNKWLSQHGKQISDVLMTQSTVCDADSDLEWIAVTLFYRYSQE